MWYEACYNEGCQKKVTANSDSTWHCEKCGTTLENCRHRYMLSATFIDHSGSTWVTAFNDSASVIFNNITADQIAGYKEEVDNHVGVFEDYIKGFLYKQFVLKARIKVSPTTRVSFFVTPRCRTRRGTSRAASRPASCPSTCSTSLKRATNC